MAIMEVAQASWNVEMARLAKEFLFDGSFFVLMTAIGLVACQGRFLHFFRPAAVVITLVFALVCGHGMARIVALPLLSLADSLNAESARNGCREKAAVVIVLGGGAVSAEIPTATTALRVLEAAKFVRTLLEKNDRQQMTIIVTGGPASLNLPVAESVAMERMLKLELGEFVARTKILSEDKSKNTFQNAIFTKELMEKNGMLKNVLVVTSQVHLSRAAATFQRAGFKVCTLSAPSPELNTGGFVSFANGEQLMRVINEYAGKVGYTARGWM